MHFNKARTILSNTNGMNIYRGCTHGCIYCDSRSSCYQMNHNFEDVEVKINALELLEKALMHKRKKCMISTGSMSDPYMHIETHLKYTRQSLEIIDKYGFGLAIQTKSDLILRDLDLLNSINKKAKCVVQITMTTYDEDLCGIVEPRVCTTKRRFEVLKIMRDNGIPTVVWFTPQLPFINDTVENVRGILNYCKEAGVYGIICFGIGLTLRDGNREFFYSKLDDHFLGLKELYRKQYGFRYEVNSKDNDKLMDIFYAECQEHGIICNNQQLFNFMHSLNDQQAEQLSLF